ncbi:MAG: peroxiredoxin [Sphingomonadales bacterium]|nr:peroxiredoxin [Sphingomonadales bacterium]
MTNIPDVGDRLPDIALVDADDRPIRIGDFGGRRLVIFFYPKDDTPGCTAENQEFSALAKDFEAAGVALLGVSKDPPARHRKFIAKYDLKLRLASDAASDGLSDALGFWAEKQNYGRSYMGMVRGSVLVDADGRIARIWRKVKAKGHAAEVLAAVRG